MTPDQPIDGLAETAFHAWWKENYPKLHEPLARRTWELLVGKRDNYAAEGLTLTPLTPEETSI